MIADTKWWNPSVHAERRERLIQRNKILLNIRNWFLNNNFVEIEPGCVQRMPCMERHLHAFRVVPSYPRAMDDLYLHTSPEFSCKKIIAAGEKKVFSLCKVWRDDFSSPVHSSEFTMLEWYCADADYYDMMAVCESMIKSVAAEMQVSEYHYGDKHCNFSSGEWERLTVDKAFEKYASVILSEGNVTDREQHLRGELESAGINCSDDDTWSDMFAKVLVGHVELALNNIINPVFLYNYPPEEAVFSKIIHNGDVKYAERFELYMAGYEIANGASELTDCTEQISRFEAEQSIRMNRYGVKYKCDDSVLKAMDTFPDRLAGVAVGVDRLVMIMTGASDITQVVWEPDNFVYGCGNM